LSNFFKKEVLEVPKKNTQKIERRHPALRTRRARLVREGIRFSKTGRMRKVATGLIINVRCLECVFVTIILEHHSIISIHRTAHRQSGRG
jgi:hypothetical protein